MSDRTEKPRGWLVAMIVMAVVGVLLAWTSAERRRSSAKLELLLQQADRLQAKMEGMAQSLEELREQSRAGEKRLSSSTPPASETLFPAEREQLAHLALVQSNTLNLVKQLAEQAKAAAAPPPITSEILTVLSNEITKQTIKVDDLTRGLDDLMIKLKVPADIMQMNEIPGDLVRLYAPYFKARRDLESQEFILERLRMRLVQSELEFAMQNAKARH